jgi:predicted O-methyltransferase YrrM
MGRALELDATWNVQLRTEEVVWQDVDARPRALWRGRPVRALRFEAGAQESERPRRYDAVADPLPVTGGGDLYSAFVEALRSWIGEIGVSAMQWSFYGVAEGDGARVADSSVFPLLALLHYLVRSNGCTRIIEAGTAAGVSAACLASAVAHREGGRVVTFDPWDHPRRAALWSLLPANIRARIDERREGSVEGMMSELAAGRTYEAALLDSVHHEDHVWREFELAAELVCPGGLILIHDATFAGGTVAAAIDRIEAAGYGVTRLWTANAGVWEDDRLGLAVIENRRRADAPSHPGPGKR